MSIIHKTIITNDGFNLIVVIHKPILTSSKVVVICHGLTGEMDGRHGQLLKLAEELCSKGFKVIRFDFRGHGKSSGIDLDVNVESLIDDLDCVFKSEVGENFDSNDIIYSDFLLVDLLLWNTLVEWD